MAPSDTDSVDEFGWILEPATTDAEQRPGTRQQAPNWRALALLVTGLTVLIGVFAFGQFTAAQTADRPVAEALLVPVPTAAPTPVATPEPTPETPPQVVDLIGEGSVVNELVFANGGGRAVLFCRESVPQTDIEPMLTMLHFASSPRHGEQLVNVQQLATPRLRSNSCEQCAGEIVVLGGEEMIAGSCVHGAPFSAGSAYVIAAPMRPDQTPLALHLSCGITSLRTHNQGVIIDAEAPLIRGLHQTRFPLPSIGISRVDGEFVADDLELLNWNCELFRSTQLAGMHRLRDEPPRSISYEQVDSAIGPIGLHPPMVIGLARETCTQLTNAWWDRQAIDLATGSPIADLIGIEAPTGHDDWFYTCQIATG